MAHSATKEDDVLLDFRDVAARLNIKASAVRARRYHGEPFFADKGVKIGRNIRWRKSDLDTYIANLPYASVDDDEE